MTAFKALTRAQWYSFIRDKQTLFWVIAFPLMFLFLFGSIFHSSNTSRSDVVLIGRVPMVDQLSGDAKHSFDTVFKVTRIADRHTAITRVNDGKAAAALAQDGNTLTVYYSQADPVQTGQVIGGLDAFVQSANVAASGKPPTFTLRTSRVENTQLKPIDSLAPGLMGWAIAQGALFNAAMPFVQWRQTKMLRRLRLAPVRTETLVGSRAVLTIGIALAQTVIFIGIAALVFGLRLHGAWWAALPLLISAALCFMGFGLVVGAIAKTAEAASGIANIIILPMAFLSGSFIPLDSAPSWLIGISKVMPLTYLNEGMKDVLVRGKGPGAVILPCAVLLVLTVIVGFIASRVFRWDADRV